MVPKLINLPRKVAILHSEVKRQYFSSDEDYLTEKDADKEAEDLVPYLKSLGIKGVPIPGDDRLINNLLKVKPDAAINLVGTIKGSLYLAAAVPSVLQMLQIPYTGTTTEGFLLGCNKFLTNTVLAQYGIPVPRFQLISQTQTALDKRLRYPLILKLNHEHSSLEITREAVVENEKQLRRRLKYLLKRYQQDVLVTEFIDGREFAAFIFYSDRPGVYITERIIKLPNNKTKHEFLDYDLTWHPGKSAADYAANLRYRPYRDSKLAVLTKRAARLMEMYSYGKFDVRMDRRGNYYFIDANSNCYFAEPEQECELTQALETAGMPLAEVLRQMLVNTMQGKGN